MTTSSEHDAAAALYEIYQRAFKVLCEADVVLSKAPDTPWLKELASAHDALSFAILPGMLRYRIISKFPEFDTDRPGGPPDSLLDADEQAFVDGLSAAQVQQIDEALLSDCASTRRKVARIIGNASTVLGKAHEDVPLGFYSQRVQALVAMGRLDSFGNLDHMRFSEVRLARDPLAAVVDAPLDVGASVLLALQAFRDGRKRTDLAEPDPADVDDLSTSLDRLADTLIRGLAAHPSRRWVLAQFHQSLQPLHDEEDDGKERFASELRRLMEILGIASDDGLLDFHLDWYGQHHDTPGA